MTTRIKLPDNGQQFDVDDAEVKTDDQVRKLLAPYYPDAKTALIKRTTEDGVPTISLVKQAGTKGIGAQGSFVEDASAGPIEIVELPIEKIRTDGNTQTRFRTSTEAIQEYADAMRAGAIFPPVKAVLDDQGNYWLYDGFHTTAAHGVVGHATVKAEVRRGEKRDALLLAVGANQAHGLRRTNDDKRRAVTILLQDAEWSQWADREIARHAGVSHTFVSNLRTELTDAVSGNGLQMPSQRMANRGGETYTFRPAVTSDDLVAQGQQSFDGTSNDLPDESSVQPVVHDQSVGMAGSPSGEPVDRDVDTEPLAQEFTPPAPVAPAVQPATPTPPTPPTAAPAPPTPSTSSLRPVDPTPPPPPPTSSLRPVSSGSETPLSFDQAQITFNIMLMPDDGNPGGRLVEIGGMCPGVLVGIRTHRLSEYGAWPGPIQEVLDYFSIRLNQLAQAASQAETR